MKIGVSSYSFGPYMKHTGANVFQIIDKAKEIGYTSIEFISVYAPEGKDPIEQAKEIKAYCAEKDLPISAYTIGADLLNKDFDVQFEELKKELAIAQALGVDKMRHDITTGYPLEKTTQRGFDDCIKVVAPRAKIVTEYAESMGIKTMFENHGTYCQDADRVEKLLNAVGSTNFGLLLDMGNFLCADEDPLIAIGKLAPYAFHVHLKDFFVRDGKEHNPGAGWFYSRSGNYLRGTIVGHGDVPVQQGIRVLLNNGYKGNISIEFEGCEENIFALKTGLENILRYYPD